MKKTIITILLAMSGIAPIICSAQVSIGKTTINGTSTLLDFYDSNDNTKGIILPNVTSAALVESLGAPLEGTFIFDESDHKIKVYQNGIWLDLSDAGENTLITANNAPDNGDGVIIGSNSSTVKGVLVLEHPTKAMILPKIQNPHSEVHQPYPGMICYDTFSKSLAVFDGKNWSYWK